MIPFGKDSALTYESSFFDVNPGRQAPKTRIWPPKYSRFGVPCFRGCWFPNWPACFSSGLKPPAAILLGDFFLVLLLSLKHYQPSSTKHHYSWLSVLFVISTIVSNSMKQPSLPSYAQPFMARLRPTRYCAYFASGPQESRALYTPSSVKDGNKGAGVQLRRRHDQPW